MQHNSSSEQLSDTPVLDKDFHSKCTQRPCPKTTPDSTGPIQYRPYTVQASTGPIQYMWGQNPIWCNVHNSPSEPFCQSDPLRNPSHPLQLTPYNLDFPEVFQKCPFPPPIKAFEAQFVRWASSCKFQSIFTIELLSRNTCDLFLYSIADDAFVRFLFSSTVLSSPFPICSCMYAPYILGANTSVMYM